MLGKNFKKGTLRLEKYGGRCGARNVAFCVPHWKIALWRRRVRCIDACRAHARRDKVVTVVREDVPLCEASLAARLLALQRIHAEATYAVGGRRVVKRADLSSKSAALYGCALHWVPFVGQLVDAVLKSKGGHVHAGLATEDVSPRWRSKSNNR